MNIELNECTHCQTILPVEYFSNPEPVENGNDVSYFPQCPVCYTRESVRSTDAKMPEYMLSNQIKYFGGGVACMIDTMCSPFIITARKYEPIDSLGRATNKNLASYYGRLTDPMLLFVDSNDDGHIIELASLSGDNRISVVVNEFFPIIKDKYERSQQLSSVLNKTDTIKELRHKNLTNSVSARMDELLGDYRKSKPHIHIG